MKKYLAVFRLRFSNTLQYRAAALAGLATQFAWGFMEIFAFAAFYRTNAAAFPMTLQRTAAYIWIQQAFLALFMTWFWESDISAAIESGSVAYELVRPMDLYSRWFSLAAANRLARCLLRAAPVLIVAFLLPAPYGMPLPPSLGQFALFLLSAALALGVVVSFAMLMYISVFYTLNPLGVQLVGGVFADFLAGGVLPLPFFPQPFRGVAELLPFAAMQNMPLRIYSGDIAGAGAARGVALQIFWLVTMTLLGKILMNRTLKKVVIQGG